MNRFRFNYKILAYCLAILGAVAFIIDNIPTQLKTGADQPDKYLGILEGKKVALIANQTSILSDSKVHLADYLVEKRINLVKIFSPEHGFRGNHSAGAVVANGKDIKTGLPIVSLYGKNKKPTKEQLADIDLLIFDIQDVGARFYTYISTLHYAMEAAAENGVSMMILDRPNPHGNYFDGPILDPGFQSFVGMHPIPVVHGMTIGEYAQMINGEGWLKDGIKCDLQVIPMIDWTHDQVYSLPIPPSPNLPNDVAIRLYPSLCFFEGTPVSVGRGTEKPFQIIGYPDFKEGDVSFVPKSIPGVSKYPKHENKECRGIDLGAVTETSQPASALDLSLLVDCYRTYPKPAQFFTPFFNKLAGSNQLKKQIEAGMSFDEIKASWQPGLEKFKETRKPYLLYP